MSQLRANSIVNSAGDGSPSFPFGIGDASVNYAAVAGIATYSSTAGIATYSSTAGIATDAQGLTGTPDITVGNVVGSTATFSGDVSVGGTITYEDVTSIDSVGVITARQGIDVTAGNITMSGSGNIDLSSGSGNITLGSNALYAGGVQYRYYVSGDDSILYHGNADGSLVSVTDTNFIVSNTGFAQTSAVFTPTGSAELYHNNSKKLETNSDGVEITGIVTASTGFRGPQYIFESADLNAWYNIPMMAQSTAGGQYSNLMVDNGGIQFNPGSNEFYLGNNIRANGNTGIITATTVDSTFVNPSRLSVSLGSWLEGYKFEEGTINTGTSLTGTFDYNILNGHVQTWSSATSGNYGPNFIINGSTIDAFTDVGDVMTATVMVASSSHYLAGANIQIDGSSANLDINYVGGSAPSAANGSGYDIYSFTIQKSAATPAYIVTVNALGAN